MTQDRYDIVVTPPAQRSLANTLPEAIATAVIEFITGPLLDNPHRVGAPLRFELEGLWSARRGTYRILYEIDEAARTVIVIRIAPVGALTDPSSCVAVPRVPRRTFACSLGLSTSI